MEIQTRNAIIGAGVGAGVGAAAGVGAGLAISKHIDNYKMVSVAQADKIRANVFKDSFKLDAPKAKVRFIDKIKNAFKANEGSFRSADYVKEAIKEKKIDKAQVKNARKAFGEAMLKCGKRNIITLCAVAAGTIATIAGGIIGNAVSKKD